MEECYTFQYSPRLIFLSTCINVNILEGYSDYFTLFGYCTTFIYMNIGGFKLRINPTTPFYFKIKKSEVQIKKSQIQIKKSHIQI